MPNIPFSQLLRQLPAGVATLEGPELRYGFVNEAMRALVGEDVDGQPIAERPGNLPTALLDETATPRLTRFTCGLP